jgi:hypothetical protein
MNPLPTSPLVVAAPVAVVFATLGAAKILALAPLRVRAAHLGFSVTAFRAVGTLARVSNDLEASAWFPQAQLFSIFSWAYYPCQRCGAYRARSKIV